MSPSGLHAVPDAMREESPEGPTQLLYTVPEAARLMGVSESTAKRYVLMGEWPSIKIGRARRVVYLGLLQWIESHSA